MFKPRIRLYGKKATQEQITNEIHSLLHGNANRPYPLSAGEIAKALGFDEEKQIIILEKIDKAFSPKDRVKHRASLKDCLQALDPENKSKWKK